MKRFQVLPEVLKDVIFSEKTSDMLSKSCTLRDVPGNKVPLVGQLTTRVLLGYLRPELFAAEIQKETGMEEMKAQHVAHDLDMEIFSEVRLELKKLYPPTLTTPTVQSWTAQKRDESGIRNQELGMGAGNLPAKPKYVIAIPEKFVKRETRNVKREIQEPPKPITVTKETITKEIPSLPPVQTPPPQQEHAPALIVPPTPPVTKEIPSLPKPAPAPAPLGNPIPKLASQTVEPSGIKIDPVVPLPTFIGSRFKNELGIKNQELGTTERVAAPPLQATSYKLPANTPIDASQRIKEAIAKFSSSSTAQPKPPADNPYKERV